MVEEKRGRDVAVGGGKKGRGERAHSSRFQSFAVWTNRKASPILPSNPPGGCQGWRQGWWWEGNPPRETPGLPYKVERGGVATAIFFPLSLFLLSKTFRHQVCWAEFRRRGLKTRETPGFFSITTDLFSFWLNARTFSVVRRRRHFDNCQIVWRPV
jgi:hypothetical protein